MQWRITTTVMVKQPQVQQKACFIIATNVLDSAILSDQELVTTFKEQGNGERGFRFLKDALFLAFSVARQKARVYCRARVDHGALLARLSSG